MPKRIELHKGDRFGRWEVLSPAPTKNGEAMYKCRCACGAVKDISSKNLRYGKTLSCGCYNKDNAKSYARKRVKAKNKIDLTGKQFGELTVIEKANDRMGLNTGWLCLCSCGKKTVVTQQNLTYGYAKSCGHIKASASSERIKKSMGIEYDTNISNIKSKKISKANTSGVRGVSYRKRLNKYEAYIGFQKKLYVLGFFDTLEEAANARKEAEVYIFGDFIEWYEDNKRKGTE